MMMSFIGTYDKAARDVGLRHHEWTEAAETTDAEEPIQAPVRSPRPIQNLAAWVTSHVHPVPVPQARRRHA